MMHKAWCSIEEVPYCFPRPSIKFQGHKGQKIDDLDQIWARLLGRSQLSNPSDLPCSRSSDKFQGHTALKIVEFDLDWAFPDCNSSLNSPMFEFTNGYEMMHKAWSSIEEVPYCFSRSSVKFQGHTALKIVEFDPDWAFPDCNSSFNTPMVTKWCTKLEVEWKRCPIVFQGHRSNCKVTRL